jgi:hypothetical protein
MRMNAWKIETDATWDASLQTISEPLQIAYNNGANVRKDLADYAKFTKAIEDLFHGKIAPHTLRPMALDEEEEKKPIKGGYVLHLPGTDFKGYFKLDFRNETGEAIMALNAPATPEQKAAIRKRFSSQ